MSSMIEELYNGNICPNAKVYSQDSRFVQAARIKSENLERLMASLDELEKEWFEKYRVAQSEIEDITRYDTFAYALKFGVQLMIEIFMGEKGSTDADDGFQ